MEIKTLLKESFSITRTPNWICPSCNKGQLKIVTNQFHYEETQQSKSIHDEDFWEPIYIKYRFHGTLKCQNCSDSISFIGNGYLDHFQYYDDHENQLIDEYNKVFHPLFFYPPLRLFQVNKKCPKEIVAVIEDSFGLYWNDLPSCANKIRTSLEMLMNFLKVKKTFIQGGKRKKMTLHNRIEIFKNSKPEIAKFLLAIKWIGNTGSHIGKLEKIDILETYEILEHSLNKLFDNTDAKLKKITKEIIKRKGTRKRK